MARARLASALKTQPLTAEPAIDPARLDAASAARLIDHTLLRPEATRDQVLQLCAEAVQYGFAAVCVNPGNVPLAVSHLRGSAVKVCGVIGFPLGATLTTVKRFEASECLRLGALELDMVMNVGALKSGDNDFVRADMRAVADIVHTTGGLLKVAIETALLTNQEKTLACDLALSAGAEFVKTSTGFAAAGATVDDVELMRRVVGNHAGVKASGGIKTAEHFRAMVQAGASRIGTSSGVAIVQAF